MKKLLYSLLMISCINVEFFGQTNLVYNGSFEEFTICPPNTNGASSSNLDIMTYATGWHSSYNTPDYLNACSTPSQVGVPNNIFGFQNAFDGNAYCGLWTYTKAAGLISRETITSQLITQLNIGQKYFVSYRVSLADNVVYSYCAINKFGALFSTKLYDASSFTSQAPINNYSQVFSNATILDKTNWTLIYGSFIADSAYNYINIGNFFTDQNLSITILNSTYNIAYYYLDDVRVSTDSLLVLSVPAERNPENTLTVYPNPTSGVLNLAFSGSTLSDLISYSITDNLGQDIREGNLRGNSYSVSTSGLAPGLYAIHLKTQFGTVTKKFIKAD